MLSGDNGLLTKAGQARDDSIVGQEKEQIQIEVLGSYNINGELNVATVNSNIKNNISGVTTDNSTEFPLTVTYTASGNSYSVDEDGNVAKAGDVPASNYGYNSAGNYFLGQKSIGKKTEGEEDNTQRSNWDANRNGYKFTAGHFVYIEDYDYYDFVQDRGAAGNVYLCWDADYGAIGSLQDLCDYSNTNEAIVCWDVFDASSGVWIYSDCRGPG